MENKLEFAKKLFLENTTKSEREICELAVESVKRIHLDDNCVLACYLYYPYIKIGIYTPPNQDELKNFDENRKKQEEAKKKEIEEQRLDFKQKLVSGFGEEVVSFLHGLKKLLEITFM